jgi:NADH-quinone oxidoreductase subunit J
MTAVVFFVFAALALAGALGVVLARNPVHSALLLVVTLVSVAVFFIQQQAHLLAAVQVIVYAGAIVVLFLFVIMLLGVDREESLDDPLPHQRTAALALGIIVLAELIFLAGHNWATGATAPDQFALKGGGAQLGNNVERVARVLFTDFLWPFEITAGLLVIAVVGSVVLARRSGQPVELVQEDVDVADDTEEPEIDEVAAT